MREADDAPWKYYFELKTDTRVYQLYAKSEEERTLWIDGFQRIFKLKMRKPDRPKPQESNPMICLLREKLALRRLNLELERIRKQSEIDQLKAEML